MVHLFPVVHLSPVVCLFPPHPFVSVVLFFAAPRIDPNSFKRSFPTHSAPIPTPHTYTPSTPLPAGKNVPEEPPNLICLRRVTKRPIGCRSLCRRFTSSWHCVRPVLFRSVLFCFVLFRSISSCSAPLCSVRSFLFCSALFHSVPFRSVMSRFVMSRSVLFRSGLSCPFPACALPRRRYPSRTEHGGPGVCSIPADS